MQIWAGLGNPGAKYALHRHNVGFMAADAIAEVHGFGPWQKKFRSLASEGRIGRHRILLLKPQTFMNDSGDAVQQALRFYKLDLDALTVFHDELDLAPMKVKVKVGGGTAGHNGLRSIDAHLGPEAPQRMQNVVLGTELVDLRCAQPRDVVRRRIDPDDQIVAILHGIDPPILGDDFELNFGISERKTSADSAERDMRDDDRGADPQRTARDRGAEHHRLARFRDFRKRPSNALV